MQIGTCLGSSTFCGVIGHCHPGRESHEASPTQGLPHTLFLDSSSAQQYHQSQSQLQDFLFEASSRRDEFATPFSVTLRKACRNDTVDAEICMGRSSFVLTLTLVIVSIAMSSLAPVQAYHPESPEVLEMVERAMKGLAGASPDRKSTRLNSSHT